MLSITHGVLHKFRFQIKKIKQHTGDPATLGTAELFCLNLSNILNYQLKIKLIIEVNILSESRDFYTFSEFWIIYRMRVISERRITHNSVGYTQSTEQCSGNVPKSNRRSTVQAVPVTSTIGWQLLKRRKYTYSDFFACIALTDGKIIICSLKCYLSFSVYN